MSAFLRQLKQRKITQWTLAYLAGAWVFLEVLGFVADHFDWPEVIVRGATITLGMGVLAALVLAWYHGEKGRQRLGLLEGVLLGAVSLITVGLLFQFSPVEPTQENSSASSGAEAGRSIAVLPFLNVAGDPGQHYFEDAIERDPLYAPAYNGLVDAVLLQSAGGYGDIPVEQNIAYALPLINRSLKLDPNLAETHASLGLLRMMERDLRASEAALLRAIEFNPNLSRAHNWLYITYEQMAEQRKAFASLQRAFALDPLSPIVNSNMGAEWWIRGNNPEALQAAQRVTQIAPDGPLGYRRYARFKRTSGELAEAVDWYRKSLEVTPGGPNSKRELGSLLVDMGYFEEAESLLGEHAYIAYLAQNRIEDALSAAHAALDMRKNDFRSIAAAARAELRAGNFKQARLLLEPLGEGHETGTGPLFRPSGIHFWDPQIAATDLVVAMLAQGDEQAGLAMLSEVKKHFDSLQSEGLDYAMLNYQQARILALQGNHEEALRVLRSVIAAGWRFWYLDGDPALKSMWDNREFRSVAADKDMLVEQERARLASDYADAIQ